MRDDDSFETFIDRNRKKDYGEFIKMSLNLIFLVKIYKSFRNEQKTGQDPFIEAEPILNQNV